MKRFTFGLENIRRWREDQAEVEEIRLQQLYIEAAQIKLREEQLIQDRLAEENRVLNAASMESRDLEALDGYRKLLAKQAAALEEEGAGCAKRIAEQKQRLVEAKKQARLLEQLKDNQWDRWHADHNRQLEQLAAESFLVRQARERR